MKFSAQEDIAAPIGIVFDAVADIDRLENAARKRGAEVTRLDEMSDPGPGMRWDVGFEFHGARRDMMIEVTDYVPPQGVTLNAEVSGIAGVGILELTPVSADRTHLEVSVELRPKTIGARVLMQAIKLAKAKIAERIDSAIAHFARGLEERRS